VTSRGGMFYSSITTSFGFSQSHQTNISLTHTDVSTFLVPFALPTHNLKVVSRPGAVFSWAMQEDRRPNPHYLGGQLVVK